MTLDISPPFQSKPTLSNFTTTKSHKAVAKTNARTHEHKTPPKKHHAYAWIDGEHSRRASITYQNCICAAQHVSEVETDHNMYQPTADRNTYAAPNSRPLNSCSTHYQAWHVTRSKPKVSKLTKADPLVWPKIKQTHYWNITHFYSGIDVSPITRPKIHIHQQWKATLICFTCSNKLYSIPQSTVKSYNRLHCQ